MQVAVFWFSTISTRESMFDAVKVRGQQINHALFSVVPGVSHCSQAHVVLFGVPLTHHLFGSSKHVRLSPVTAAAVPYLGAFPLDICDVTTIIDQGASVGSEVRVLVQLAFVAAHLEVYTWTKLLTQPGYHGCCSSGRMQSGADRAANIVDLSAIEYCVCK